MWKTIVRRLLIMIPQLILISLLMFILASIMPGDALTGMIDNNVSPKRLEELRVIYGFYDPWYVKYFRWAGGILRGDFGTSMAYKIPVAQLIAERATNTISLSLLTAFFMYLIAVPLGIISGRFNGKKVDKAITFYSYLALAMPSIVMGLINIYYFGYKLHWFPTSGSVSVSVMKGTIEYIFSRFYHMFLPAITLAMITTTSTIQYLRSEIVDYENSDFVTTARSKGVPERVIYNKHIFRNSLIPIASQFGLVLAAFLRGSILTETIFGYPGLGRLFIDTIARRDFATVNILILLFSVVTVVGGLISDIILILVDPRIRIK